MMAKQIIAEEKTVLVPEIKIAVCTAQITDLPKNIIDHMPCYELHEAMKVVGVSVDLEKSIENFRPDAIVYTKRGEILVEFLVRHRVDEAKKEKAKAYGSAMLEVDLSEYTETPITHDELRDIIVSKADLKTWVYYPLSETALHKARTYYENLDIVKDYREKLLEQERERAEALKKKQRQAAARERGNAKVKQLFELSHYGAELDRLRNDDALVKLYDPCPHAYWYDFGRHFQRYHTVPFFVDIPITGEMVFQCDRRVWQSILFNRYIFGRKQDGARFTIKNIYSVLKEDYSIKIDYDLSYKLPDPLHEDKEIRLGQDVIRTYFKYLETIGFIITEDHRGGYEKACWKTVQARKTTDPPDKYAADHLLDAIKSVDRRSPDINDLIRDKMGAYYEEKRKQEKKAAEEAERLENERKAAEKARREQEQKWEQRFGPRWMYDLGKQDVEKYDFDELMNRYDRFDKRWFRCKVCDQIKRREEMSSYEYGRGRCAACKTLNDTKESKS
jgi:hypothetical protein